MSINGVAFNSIGTLLSCATNQGYVVYSLDPLLERRIVKNIGGLSHAKIFNRTNIAVLVGGGVGEGIVPYKPREYVVLMDQSTSEAVIELYMGEPVRNVLVAKNRIIAVVERKVCIFDWEGKMINVIETYYNPLGLCVLDEEHTQLITLGVEKGSCSVWNYETGTHTEFVAHRNNIEAIAVSKDGKLVGSASETGTLVRVWDISTQSNRYEFRRGTQSASIYSIGFNQTNRFIACSSSNGTLHIFHLHDQQDTTKNTQSYLSGIRYYLPSYFSSEWNYKQVSLGNCSRSNVIFEKNDDILVVTLDGQIYRVACNSNQYDTVDTLIAAIGSE